MLSYHIFGSPAAASASPRPRPAPARCASTRPAATRGTMPSASSTAKPVRDWRSTKFGFQNSKKSKNTKSQGSQNTNVEDVYQRVLSSTFFFSDIIFGNRTLLRTFVLTASIHPHPFSLARHRRDLDGLQPPRVLLPPRDSGRLPHEPGN